MSDINMNEKRGPPGRPLVDEGIKQLIADLYTPLKCPPREAPSGRTAQEREASRRKMAEKARQRAQEDLRRARRAAQRVFNVRLPADKRQEVERIFGDMQGRGFSF